MPAVPVPRAGCGGRSGLISALVLHPFAHSRVPTDETAPPVFGAVESGRSLGDVSRDELKWGFRQGRAGSGQVSSVSGLIGRSFLVGDLFPSDMVRWVKWLRH